MNQVQVFVKIIPFVVVDDVNKIIKQSNGLFNTKIKEKVLFPTDTVIPLIVESVGCIGIVRIVSAIHQVDDSTVIAFKFMDTTQNDPYKFDVYYSWYLQTIKDTAKYF